MLLARRGFNVTVVERSRIPSDTLSTHGIARGGVVQLARWGLLDDVLASGAPAIRQVVFRCGDDETVRPLKAQAGVDQLIAPRRYILDAIVARAAVEAGATIRTGVTATGVLRADDGRIRGIRARTADGTSLELPAKLTVGADGVRSRTARFVGAPILQAGRADAATFYVYVAGLRWRGFEYHVGRNAFAGVFPTHDGEACVWVCGPESITAAAATDFVGLMAKVSPSLAARVAQGHITSRVRGAARLPNHLRQASGPGWALVGDAGYHRDPVSGHGITDAFRDAELLARHVHNPGEYARQRDAAVQEIFAITQQMARFPEPARFIALQRQLSRALDAEAEELASQEGFSQESDVAAKPAANEKEGALA
jgi:flavin-dependent dehydrogenase